MVDWDKIGFTYEAVIAADLRNSIDSLRYTLDCDYAENPEFRRPSEDEILRCTSKIEEIELALSTIDASFLEARTVGSKATGALLDRLRDNWNIWPVLGWLESFQSMINGFYEGHRKSDVVLVDTFLNILFAEAPTGAEADSFKFDQRHMLAWDSRPVKRSADIEDYKQHFSNNGLIVNEKDVPKQWVILKQDAVNYCVENDLPRYILPASLKKHFKPLCTWPELISSSLDVQPVEYSEYERKVKAARRNVLSGNFSTPEFDAMLVVISEKILSGKSFSPTPGNIQSALEKVFEKYVPETPKSRTSVEFSRRIAGILAPQHLRKEVVKKVGPKKK